MDTGVINGSLFYIYGVGRTVIDAFHAFNAPLQLNGWHLLKNLDAKGSNFTFLSGPPRAAHRYFIPSFGFWQPPFQYQQEVDKKCTH